MGSGQNRKSLRVCVRGALLPEVADTAVPDAGLARPVRPEALSQASEAGEGCPAGPEGLAGLGVLGALLHRAAGASVAQAAEGGQKPAAGERADVPLGDRAGLVGVLGVHGAGGADGAGRPPRAGAPRARHGACSRAVQAVSLAPRPPLRSQALSEITESTCKKHA